MKDSKPSYGFIALVLILCGGFAWNVAANTVTRLRLDAVLKSKSASMETSWRSAKLGHRYLTNLGNRDPEETNLEHSARHKVGVLAMLSVFPNKD